MAGQRTYRELVDEHGWAKLSSETGFKERYLRQIYAGERLCGRKVMLRLKEAFPEEFSADADLEAEAAEEVAA